MRCYKKVTTKRGILAVIEAHNGFRWGYAVTLGRVLGWYPALKEAKTSLGEYADLIEKDRF